MFGLKQNYSEYNDENKLVWSLLYKKQADNLNKKAAKDFLIGMQKMEFEPEQNSHIKTIRAEQESQKSRRLAGFWKMLGTFELSDDPLRLPPETMPPSINWKLYGYSPPIVHAVLIQTGSEHEKPFTIMEL